MQRDLLVRCIGAVKLAKGIVLVALGIGALALIHHDLPDFVRRWIDLGHDHVRQLFEQLDSKKLKELGAGSFAYAALFLIEGVGLLRRRRWAEYLTIAITTSFIPFEIYELLHTWSTAKLVVLLANIAVVIYLIVRRVQAHHHAQHAHSRRPKLDLSSQCGMLV